MSRVRVPDGAPEADQEPQLLVLWPVGQAVKTAASHAVNVGSIPARDVLSKAECIRKISNIISAFLFFQVENGMEYQLIRKESY